MESRSGRSRERAGRSEGRSGRAGNSKKPLQGRQILLAAVGGAVGLTVTMVAHRYFRGDFDFDQKLLNTANAINKTCPRQVDSETVLNNTMAQPGRRFCYFYSLPNLKAADMDVEGFRKQMRPQLINLVKTSSDMKDFREAGVTLVYTYRDKEGVEVAKLVIKPADYR